jgi:dolichol kinase
MTAFFAVAMISAFVSPGTPNPFTGRDVAVAGFGTPVSLVYCIVENTKIHDNMRFPLATGFGLSGFGCRWVVCSCGLG